jgi:uncharacterized protein
LAHYCGSLDSAGFTPAVFEMKTMWFKSPLLMITLGVIGALLIAAVQIAEIDTDITRFLPKDDPVIADAGLIFKHHPLQGQIAIDLGVSDPDPGMLIRNAQLVEQRLQASGLFNQVGMEALQALMPDLLRHVVAHLPVLFSAQDLQTQVLPRLSHELIQHRLTELQTRLLGLDAIGQAAFMARDPLALHDIVLAKLAHLAPSGEIAFEQGQLLSADGRHLLIVATPSAPGTDTAFAARLDRFMTALADEVRELSGVANPVTLTPMGAYRAALDNEHIARRDVQKAIGLATFGIAVLLLLAFPRPLLGLFAFLPALAGTAAAFFVIAVMHKNISIMALGFGGAIISITVDHGIAYLLFLDQTRTTYGKRASREIWAIGLMAALTTIGAFSALNLTGFPVLAQLGQFAALGIGFSFLFVHLVFPKIFPQLPPAKPRALPFRRLVAMVPTSGKYTAWAAIAFACGMLFFARPTFDASLSSMNTVSKQTAEAERLMTRVWGSGLLENLFLMVQAGDRDELQTKGDRILALVDEDMQAGRLHKAFVPAMLFPGEQASRRNFVDWQAFWTAERVAATRAAFDYGRYLGFKEEAFNPFLSSLSAAEPPAHQPIPEAFHALLGIVKQSQDVWMQYATLSPGPHHDPQRFHDRYGNLAKIFDPGFFSEKLGQLLFSTFVKMLAVIGVSVALLIFFFFLDLKLSAITLAPMLFALVCTLGTLNLIGHPLDIPGLMLAIVVLGMGTDYSLLLVRAYQRYGGVDDPGFERIKMAVVMASFSTLLGFGVLCTAEHSLLYSAGLTSLLGVGYSLIGAFVLLPPLLVRHLHPCEKAAVSPPGDINQRVLRRYQSLEAYPRLFARCKLKMDKLFDELAMHLADLPPPRTIVDIGCGYGVPGCWLLEKYAGARIQAIDPNPEKTRVAALVFKERGTVICGQAPNGLQPPRDVDLALLLDVVYHLDEEALALMLQRLRNTMAPGALLVMRTVVTPEPQAPRSWLGWVEALRVKLTAMPLHQWRREALAQRVRSSGFRIQTIADSGGHSELIWIIATSPPNGAKKLPGGDA